MPEPCCPWYLEYLPALWAAGAALAIGIVLFVPRVRCLVLPWLEARRALARLYVASVVAVILCFLPINSLYGQSQQWFSAHRFEGSLLGLAFLWALVLFSWPFLVRCGRRLRDHGLIIFIG